MYTICAPSVVGTLLGAKCSEVKVLSLSASPWARAGSFCSIAVGTWGVLVLGCPKSPW